MAWDLGDIASAKRKRSNDHELGRQSHSKKLLCAKVVLRMGAWTSVSTQLVLRALTWQSLERQKR